MSFLQNILPPFIRSNNPNNPQTNLANPAEWLTEFLSGGGRTNSGANVNESTVMGIPAVWSAVELISGDMAGLPFDVFRREGDNKNRDTSHPIYELLNSKANNYMTSFNWRRLMELSVLLWGNGYSFIDFDFNTMRPKGLIPFHPSKVTVAKQGDTLVYKFQTSNNEDDIIVPQAQVLHIKELGFDGIKGKSRLTTLRENLGLSISEQEAAATFFGKGMRGTHAVTAPNGLKKKGVDNIRKTLKAQYATARGEQVVILDNGMDIKQLTIPSKDAEFVDQRKFSITDISRIFRVPPPLLYDLERATFSNIEKLLITYVKTLTPRCINWEQEINTKLFMEDEKGKVFAEKNLDGLLRGDQKTRSEAHKLSIQNGWASPNEVRAKENMNGYDGGDEYYVPSNQRPVSEPFTQQPVTQPEEEPIEEPTEDE